MHENAPDSDRAGGLQDSQRCVAEKCPANTKILVGLIDGQPAQDYNWNGVRHVSPEAPCCKAHTDRTRRQGIIADDLHVMADHINAGCSAGLIGKRAPCQPFVKDWHTRLEPCEIVVFRERKRSFHATYFSQGGAVSKLFLSRAFGSGGASSFFRKSA